MTGWQRDLAHGEENAGMCVCVFVCVLAWGLGAEVAPFAHFPLHHTQHTHTQAWFSALG